MHFGTPHRPLPQGTRLLFFQSAQHHQRALDAAYLTGWFYPRRGIHGVQWRQPDAHQPAG